MAPSVDIYTLLQTGGAVGVLVFIVLANLRGWFVTGSVYKDLLNDRDDWKEIALKSVGASEKAVDLAQFRRVERGRRAP